MEPIRIRAKLSAYTKGLIPTKVSQLENDEEYITEAPKDEFAYARKDGEWLKLDSTEFGDNIELLDNSGLILEKDGNKAKLKIDQFVLKQEEFDRLSSIDENATYYTYERTPDLYVNGGTAFSDGDNEYVDLSQYGIEMNGGKAHSNFELELLPINAKGVYNGYKNN